MLSGRGQIAHAARKHGLVLGVYVASSLMVWIVLPVGRVVQAGLVALSLIIWRVLPLGWVGKAVFCVERLLGWLGKVLLRGERQLGGWCTTATTGHDRGHEITRRYSKDELRRVCLYKLLECDCVLALQRGDITQWNVDGKTDAIVNAANEGMLGGSGVDGAIHEAAGPGLREACMSAPEVRPGVRCPKGSAKITGGFKLPVSHIIHTVGPVYHRETKPALLLASAYTSSMDVARENGIKYIAFPAISCGIYGYPVEEAADVSLRTIGKSGIGLKEVHFVLFEQAAWKAWKQKADELFQRIIMCE